MNATIHGTENYNLKHNCITITLHYKMFPFLIPTVCTTKVHILQCMNMAVIYINTLVVRQHT